MIRHEQLINGFRDLCHCLLTAATGIVGRMADFLSVLGCVAFAAVMLGLIWALDRV